MAVTQEQQSEPLLIERDAGPVIGSSPAAGC
jgi:hypothetical protein